MRDVTSAHASAAPARELSAREAIDLIRVRASRQLDESRRAERGQYFTPPHVARLMASMLRSADRVTLLDPGAGSGALLGAAVLELLSREERPSVITITASEIDDALLSDLRDTIAVVGAAANQAQIKFEAEVWPGDFIEPNVRRLRNGFFRDDDPPSFTHAILNPPYGKIRGDSQTRALLDALGVGSGNLYTGFLAVVVELLAPGGELVAITPRSFCNGPYFKSFRRWFLREMSLQHIHVFESRSTAFKDDAVLQENVIIHAVKAASRPSSITISSSAGDADEAETTRAVSYNSVIQSDDPDSFIHIVPDEAGEQIVQAMANFGTTLDELRISVSTGRVVDFRVRDLLRQDPEDGTLPLIYPTHFNRGYIKWPKTSRKPNAILDCQNGDDQALPPGSYVLVKRFSAKEEPRRIVAAIYDSDQVSPTRVAFENHLNFFHASGAGLPKRMAIGLALYLNSSLVDQFFRHFSGHTQVNATDLRKLRYPTRLELERIGGRFEGEPFPSQEEIDSILRQEFPSMVDQARDPVQARQRIEDALDVLRSIGMPKAQVNDRSALTLLALVDLKAKARWSKAGNPLRGITPLMDFIRDEYGRNYAPNSRETIRRFTMHQFVEAGVALPNPDNPGRAVNSPDFVYQIEPAALELLRAYRTASWKKHLAAYLASIETLRSRYAQERAMNRIELKLPDGVVLISPGGQNILIEQIIKEFCPRFTPGGKPLYIGDAGEKFSYFDRDTLAKLGVQVDEHGKMPDVIVHHVERDWLVLIEAVTSHGPVNAKRHNELKTMFANSSAGLVFVTAFLSRQAMSAYLAEIAWETEVWSADTASHLIHFNGERFLGPYS